SGRRRLGESGRVEGGDRRAEDCDRRAARYLSDHLLTEPAELLPEDPLIQVAQVGQVLDLQCKRQLEEVRMDDLPAASAPAVALPDDIAEAVDAGRLDDYIAEVAFSHWPDARARTRSDGAGTCSEAKNAVHTPRPRQIPSRRYGIRRASVVGAQNDTRA